MTIYRLSYRWLDIADSRINYEYYENLQDALNAREKMFSDEIGRQTMDPKSIGQFEIVIDLFEYTREISRGNV
jgi:hypothetical protein